MNTPHRLRKTVGLHLKDSQGILALLDTTDSAIRFVQDDAPQPLTADAPQLATFLQHLRTLLIQALDDRRHVLDSAILAVPAALPHPKSRR